jgi:cation diffusion facilitator CzcD-associated flavoprotein CzcO
MQSAGCFVVDGRQESAWDVTEEERIAWFEELWNAPGLSILTRNFNDVLVDRAANDEVMRFLERKIRERITDPAVADKLIPKHRFGTKRPPLESGYYEIFNRPNVELVDLTEEPIVQFNEKGIETTQRQLDVDDIVLATGFDSLGGSFMRLGLKGDDGVSLEEWWAHGPRTYLGLTAHHFPNLFFVGPQGVGGNFPRCAEGAVEWITTTLRDLKDKSVVRIEASAQAENDWVEMIAETVTHTVHVEGESWFWGSNVPGKARSFGAYLFPMPIYRAKLDEVRSNEYDGFELSYEDGSVRRLEASEPAGVEAP